jgi:hypothetical protein
MITGCNTNIRHREKVFHVQTEDSGRANPHIISHVYYGGTIVGSRKQDYSDALESVDLDREVRGRIEEQHKAMLKALRRGEFDAAIGERLADSPGATAPELDEAVSLAEPAPVVQAVQAVQAVEAVQVGAPVAQVSQTGATTGNVTAPQVDTNPELEIGPPLPTERTEKVARPGARAAFGDSVDAQKPLDEVILEYLVEKARERSSERRSPAKTRSEG